MGCGHGSRVDRLLLLLVGRGLLLAGWGLLGKAIRHELRRCSSVRRVTVRSGCCIRRGLRRCSSLARGRR